MRSLRIAWSAILSCAAPPSVVFRSSPHTRPLRGYSRAMPQEQLTQWVEQSLPIAGAAALPCAALELLPAEASARRFYRVRLGASTFVAMHAPCATADNRRFVALARLLRAGGIRAPEVHAVDFERGFLLVEDLGERDFAAAYRQGETDAALEGAIQALVLLQSLPRGDIPPYTEARFADELDIFAQWLIGKLLASALPPWFPRLCATLVAATQAVPQRPVHRDYHSRNLIWRHDGTVGVVDFQDALIGPATYDIASLLRDCYHAFDEPTVAKWRQRYLDLARVGVAEDEFARAFDLTALQRQLKAVGIFARLWLRDGRRSHLSDIVPVLRRIALVAHGYPETRELAAWIDADVLPMAARRLARSP